MDMQSHKKGQTEVEAVQGHYFTHDNGDVSKEHEIQLGFWHHGRVPGHSDIQKNQSRKDFPAIKFFFYKIVPISLNFPPDCSSKIDILPCFPQKLRGNIF